MILRELTRFDEDRARHLYRRWTLRSVLLAYVHGVLMAEAQHAWELQTVLWGIRIAFGGKEKPPKLPAILETK